jgi:hypothetical protein
VIDQAKLPDSRSSTFANISNVVGSSEATVGIHKEARAEQNAIPAVESPVIRTLSRAVSKQGKQPEVRIPHGL